MMANNEEGNESCMYNANLYNCSSSMMRGRIKGTDSTINAILATAVLYELQWKTARVKTVMTNTVAYTRVY